MEALIVIGTVAFLAWVVNWVYDLRIRYSREVRDRAIGGAERRPLERDELKQLVLEAWRADHAPILDYAELPYEEKLRLAGHLWRLGEGDRYPLLHECVHAGCTSFRDVRRFVRWYDRLFSDERRFHADRLTHYDSRYIGL